MAFRPILSAALLYSTVVELHWRLARHSRTYAGLSATLNLSAQIFSARPLADPYSVGTLSQARLPCCELLEDCRASATASGSGTTVPALLYPLAQQLFLDLSAVACVFLPLLLRLVY